MPSPTCLPRQGGSKRGCGRMATKWDSKATSSRRRLELRGESKMSSPSRASISGTVDYGAAKTPYVRSLIAATSWEQHAIVADLLRIERCVELRNAGQLCGFAANMMFHWLRQTYAPQTE